jgi:hypothetical protein
MFSATFYFLGLAGFIVAASACLSVGRRAGRRAQLDLADLHSASVSLVTLGRKPSWEELRSLWMVWYARCQESAVARQKAIYSWARTLALCAVLCIIGALLEGEFDEPISLSRVLSGFRHSAPAAATMSESPAAGVLHGSDATASPRSHAAPTRL